MPEVIHRSLQTHEIQKPASSGPGSERTVVRGDPSNALVRRGNDDLLTRALAET
jgi:hypothetical protein